MVVKDSGFSEWLPVGEGILAFRGVEEAVEAITEFPTTMQHTAATLGPSQRVISTLGMFSSGLVESAATHPKMTSLTRSPS